MTHITEKNKKISIFNSVKKAIKKIKNYYLLQRWNAWQYYALRKLLIGNQVKRMCDFKLD